MDNDPSARLTPDEVLDVVGDQIHSTYPRRLAAPILRQPLELRIDDMIRRAGWIQDMLVTLKREYQAVQAEIDTI